MLILLSVFQAISTPLRGYQRHTSLMTTSVVFYKERETDHLYSAGSSKNRVGLVAYALHLHSSSKIGINSF